MCFFKKNNFLVFHYVKTKPFCHCGCKMKSSTQWEAKNTSLSFIFKHAVTMRLPSDFSSLYKLLHLWGYFISFLAKFLAKIRNTHFVFFDNCSTKV